MTTNTTRSAAKGRYVARCVRADGQLRWEEGFLNLVTIEGHQFMADTMFRGAGYTAEWYLGLFGAASANTPTTSDTMGDHPGWSEFTGYDGDRPEAVFAAATATEPVVTTNEASVATFTITAAGPATVGGAFLTTSDTKGGTTGVLYSVGPFAAPGDRVVYAGDLVFLTYEHELGAVPE